MHMRTYSGVMLPIPAARIVKMCILRVYSAQCRLWMLVQLAVYQHMYQYTAIL